jgi:hypothetical protein
VVWMFSGMTQYFVLIKSIWFNICHMIIKAHAIFKTPATNFPTKGLRSKHRSLSLYFSGSCIPAFK